MGEYRGWVGIPSSEYLYLIVRSGMTLESMDGLIEDLSNCINASPDFWGDFWNRINEFT